MIGIVSGKRPRKGRSMSRRWIVLIVLILVVVAVGYVGHAYFDNFNNVGANPNCVSDCWENGKRVR